MSAETEFEDFESLLEPNFNPTQYASELLRAINNDRNANDLDIITPLKKITYEIDEVNSRTEKILKESPIKVLEQLDKRNSAKDKVSSTLKPSLDYLSMSYERLNTEILKPYESALVLQSALGKIHETSALLRNALIYLHMAAQIEASTLEVDNPESMARLTALCSQLRMNIDQNPNLNSLNIIKKFENGVLKEKRLKLASHASQALIKLCASSRTIEHNADPIKSLALTLYINSPKEFSSTLDRIALAKIQVTNQVLAKTITSVRSLKIAMDDAAASGLLLLQLQGMLESVQLENSTLLQEYLSQKKYNSITTNYWVQVANAFQKQFEISYRRGGPVGKSLQANSQFIKQSITECMQKSASDESYKEYLNIMLSSVSILDNEKR
ncbi:HFL336Cp [Eremothecium sinecaudum]|uniref:Conserved oligomeric Golgi complex subunit 5 n=1 Tax=Eremothecium sinecaudum TaxID=45286 RepID=A0A0X8HU45_9SACH|nr:HFL336Cp [Eremothecium sinecaudum]AMD21520.1 HFL336Cp [Eremothecium sinecaudum]